ncbi:MAG: hypothetical protein IPL94_12720 [Tetrasphaera sp.]|nr:hypothetical protein [Tetrasphaera sp.]
MSKNRGKDDFETIEIVVVLSARRKKWKKSPVGFVDDALHQSPDRSFDVVQVSLKSVYERFAVDDADY